MIRMSLEQVLDATGADLVRPPKRAQAAQLQLQGVSTDSRQVEPGNLFVALSGPNFDGNRFLAAAAQAGARAVLARAEPNLDLEGLPPAVGLAVHPDPARALTDLAAWHRSRLSATVLGITGSSGKTSTKNLALELFGQHLRTVGSPKSFNNAIGVPLTIFQADEATELLVLEIGTSGPGEIAALARIAQPDIAVITNIGAAHLERLGSLEGVAKEKSALAEALTEQGLFVLDADGPFAACLRSSTKARTKSISLAGAGDWNAEAVAVDGAGSSFLLCGRRVRCPLPGRHNLKNLLMVLAVGEELGLDVGRLLDQVPTLSGSKQRLQRLSAGGVTIFDDSYNANPDSAGAAIETLSQLPCAGRRVFVLGDMLELGGLSLELHHRVGMSAAASGLDLFLAIGQQSAAAAAGALEGGLPAERVIHFESVEAALERVPELLLSGDTALIKGSRGMRLERLVEALIQSRKGPIREPG